MKLVLILFSFIFLVSGHTHLHHLTIKNKALERGECIRPYMPAPYFIFPQKDPLSDKVRCRTPSPNDKATSQCPVDAGTNVTINWYASSDLASPGINPSHKGPCLVYMARLESNDKEPAWFKIFEQGYNSKTKKWCIDNVNANNGKLEVTIPKDLKAGGYLFRSEIIALHLARVPYDGAKMGAEYYSNCAELIVSGTGNAVPKGVAIPGVYQPNDKSLVFDISKPYDSYKIPGPPLYRAGQKQPCTKRRRRKRAN